MRSRAAPRGRDVSRAEPRGRASPVDPRLLRYAAGARRHLLVAAGIGVATTLLVLVQAFAVTELVVRPFAGQTGSAALRGPLLLLAVVVACRAGLVVAGEVAAHRAAATVKSELRRGLLAHVVALGPSWLGRQRAGELATLVTRGTDALDGYFARYLPALFTAALVPAAVVAVVSTQDPLSGLIVAATLPLVPVFAVLVGMATRARTARQWHTLAALGGHFLDVVEGLPTLVVFRRAKAQAAIIREVSDSHRRATMSTLRLAFLSSAVLELVATLSVALVAVSIGLRLLGGGLDLRTGLVVLVLTPEAYWPLRQVGAHFHDSVEGLAAAREVFAVLDTPLSPGGARPARPAPDLRRTTIRLQGVQVRYDRAKAALGPVEASIAPGELVGLVGPSGSGKSTLLAVLLGFLAPTAGRVVLETPDGPVDLAEVDPDDWRAQIAWVPQQPWLAPASLAENLRLARAQASDDELVEALTQAGAGPLLARLPDGLGTVLGERGAGLSAGERQRVALARAFLRRAPLVLLDEASAHLDEGTESVVAAAVRGLAGRHTVVVVAHRPALLQGVDRLVVLSAADPAAARTGAVRGERAEPAPGGGPDRGAAA